MAFGPTASARVWRISTNRQVTTLRHSQPLMGAALSPTGRLLATATLHDRVTIWPCRSAGDRATPAPDRGQRRELQPRRASALHDELVRKVWEVRTRRTRRELRQDSQVLVSAFSPDGRRIVTGDVDGVGRVWMSARVG